MREKYRKQLEELEMRMKKAEAFAERCPLFAEYILENILTGQEEWYTFVDRYKSLRTHGVYRGHYSSKTNRKINNYDKEHDAYLFVVFINTIAEYDSHAKYGLGEIQEKTPVFFYDKLNSTFYCTDEQIGDLLEALDEWKINALAQAKIDRRDADIKEIEEAITLYKTKLEKLKE